MKELVLISLIFGALVSCNKETETKKLTTPKIENPSAEELLSAMYTNVKGFECELRDVEDSSNIFYIDKSSENKDGALSHHFYSVIKGNDIVYPYIKLSTKKLWMARYDSETDGIYKASPIVIKADGSDKALAVIKAEVVEETAPEEAEEGVIKIQGASISFDSHTNEFEIFLTEKIITTDVVFDSVDAEVKKLNKFTISNCIEAEYKILVGLD